MSRLTENLSRWQHKFYIAGGNFRADGAFKNVDVVMNQTFWLSIFPNLSAEQLDYMVDKLEQLFDVNF